jgi:hypothetical protein
MRLLMLQVNVSRAHPQFGARIGGGRHHLSAARPARSFGDGESSRSH